MVCRDVGEEFMGNLFHFKRKVIGKVRTRRRPRLLVNTGRERRRGGKRKGRKGRKGGGHRRGRRGRGFCKMSSFNFS